MDYLIFFVIQYFRKWYFSLEHILYETNFFVNLSTLCAKERSIQSNTYIYIKTLFLSQQTQTYTYYITTLYYIQSNKESFKTIDLIQKTTKISIDSKSYFHLISYNFQVYAIKDLQSNNNLSACILKNGGRA